MTLVTTTLVNPIGGSDLVILLASVANFSSSFPRNPAAPSPVPFLLIEQEMVQPLSIGVTVANGTYVNVQRGVEGTCAVPHGASITVISGFSEDFAGFRPSRKAGFVR